MGKSQYQHNIHFPMNIWPYVFRAKMTFMVYFWSPSFTQRTHYGWKIKRREPSEKVRGTGQIQPSRFRAPLCPRYYYPANPYKDPNNRRRCQLFVFNGFPRLSVLSISVLTKKYLESVHVEYWHFIRKFMWMLWSFKIIFEFYKILLWISRLLKETI